MTLEKGIMVGGKVVPGTEWVLRETRGWFAADPAVGPTWRDPADPVGLLVLDRTAGPDFHGPDAARTTVRNAARVGRSSPMAGSARCGSATSSWDQTADVGLLMTHIGSNGHLHVPGSTKADGAGYFVEALLASAWSAERL